MISLDAYESTVSQLQKLGKCEWVDRHEWPNREEYKEFSLEKTQVSELIKIIEDDIENQYSEQSNFWFAVHAWRILASHKVEKAIPQTIDRLIQNKDDNDWGYEELPEVLALYGPIAITYLKKALFPKLLFASEAYGYVSLSRALTEIAKSCGDYRDEICIILRKKLAEYETSPIELTTFLISDLLELKDLESVLLIQEVFSKEFVDEEILDWDWVTKCLSDVCELPNKIILHEHPNMEFSYGGDEKFQKTLKATGCFTSVEDAKLLTLGAILAVDMVHPSQVIEQIATDDDNNEISFGSKGQSQYFVREFIGLWQQMTKYQNEVYRLPSFEFEGKDDSINSIYLFKRKFHFVSFLEGLSISQSDGVRLDDTEFISKLELFVEELGELKEQCSHPEFIQKSRVLLKQVESYWNKNYLNFANACTAAIKNKFENEQFVAENKRVGRNEPCPCDSGKKFKKCCLMRYH